MQNNLNRENLNQIPWETLTDKETLQKLYTNKEGLSQTVASQRLIDFGEKASDNGNYKTYILSKRIRLEDLDRLEEILHS